MLRLASLHLACLRRIATAAASAALALSTLFAPTLHAQQPPAQAQLDEPRFVPAYVGRPEVRAFIDEMVERHGFDRARLDGLFSRARYQPMIAKAMDPIPRGSRNWNEYRRGFVNQRNVDEGAQFWAQHRAALQRAEQQYGVPAEIIVAIIGIETRYGRHTGSWRVLDALATLAFDYPRRAAFFKSELEHFLLYARESKLDPVNLRGSVAGAVGIPQFMPGSYRRWAVDFDGDGRRDLLGSPVDAIGSVANFLREHGWIPGQPTAFQVSVDGEQHKLLLEAGIKPAFSVTELESYGITLKEELPEDTQVALVEMESPDAPPVYYVGLDNFYAITRYNQSSFYAISVIELGRALRGRGR